MPQSDTSLDQLVARAQRVARLPSPESTLVWLRCVATLLSDWGGKAAGHALKEALPGALWSGKGSSGRSHAAAVKEAGGSAGTVALHLEAGKRANERDPAKVAIAVRPLMGLLRERLGAVRSETVAAALPPAVAAEFRAATTESSYRYFLLPQSYTR